MQDSLESFKFKEKKAQCLEIIGKEIDIRLKRIYDSDNELHIAIT